MKVIPDSHAGPGNLHINAIRNFSEVNRSHIEPISVNELGRLATFYMSKRYKGAIAALLTNMIPFDVVIGLGNDLNRENFTNVLSPGKTCTK